MGWDGGAEVVVELAVCWVLRFVSLVVGLEGRGALLGRMGREGREGMGDVRRGRDSSICSFLS